MLDEERKRNETIKPTLLPVCLTRGANLGWWAGPAVTHVQG